KDGSYSIRLTSYIDNASTASLYFVPIRRKLKPNHHIPIGRYTERNKDALLANANSSASIVFKSKVVSRTHAQLLVDDLGNWFIKDLKSSSGTFLNRRRLSSPNEESISFQLHDGDLLQLGMDYRGGSEEIYRCVKIRIELNKSWKLKSSNFNKKAHEKLKILNHPLSNNMKQSNGVKSVNTNKMETNDYTECAICLYDCKPCQAIFIAACSHCWHYKCIRRIILNNYPQFLCPNCRSVTDLESNVDDDD
ncbi:ubiquitin-conjugating protein DMA1 ASCRUDRAFT_26174, partial [Ascoidea rubescens DSM 1968]